MCSDTKSKKWESYEEKIKRNTVIKATTAETQRFLSKMIVIIIKRISMYWISILNKIFNLEGRK